MEVLRRAIESRNGGYGDDKITGTQYNDTINGGAGNDTIYGTVGNDYISGGAGENTIVYTSLDQLGDTINLTKGENLKIDVSALNVSADEILTISSAIVDAYRITGAKLYVDKYTEAGMQKAATPTYVVTSETATLMDRDPNILDKAIEALRARYRAIDSTNIRNEYINKAIEKEETPEENLQQKMQESIESTIETRQRYLDSLSGTVQ